MSISRTASQRAGKTTGFLLMLVGSLAMVVPFVWMIVTSLKKSKLVFEYPPQWIPDPVTWSNYKDIWDVAPLAQGLINSATVTTLVVVFGTLSSTMAAFAFAKLDFPHKQVIFVSLLATMMIPGVVMIIPQFLVYSHIGWIDTLLPLFVPGMLGNISMIFFLRQYMMGLSNELMDAAKLDGAGFFRIYWSIFLPLCKPAIAANVIIIFMATWNDYMGPLIFTHSPRNSTVQLVIASLSSHYAEQTNYPLVMASSVVAVLPVLLLFVGAQKYFVESFAFSGIKG